jgi:sirohydrochlorin ferrochelatase
VSTAAPPLIIAAHGSGDPAFAAIVAALARQVRGSQPDLDVRIGYLEHGPPRLVDVVEPGAVVVPLLLSSGYHAAVDIPAQAAGALIAKATGPDQRLVPVLAARLRHAGWAAGTPVVLAAPGSTEESALAEVRDVGLLLADALDGADVTVAFISSGTPTLSALRLSGVAVSSYLLAPGHYSRIIANSGAGLVGAPLGAAPELAEIILDRYAATADRRELELAQPGRTAPM